MAKPIKFEKLIKDDGYFIYESLVAGKYQPDPGIHNIDDAIDDFCSRHWKKKYIRTAATVDGLFRVSIVPHRLFRCFSLNSEFKVSEVELPWMFKDKFEMPILNWDYPRQTVAARRSLNMEAERLNAIFASCPAMDVEESHLDGDVREITK